MKKVVDGHTHGYPGELISDPGGWAHRMGEEYWGKLVTDQQGHKSLQGWADRERFLRDMDKGGVETVVLMGWYWERQATCRWHHEIYRRWAEDIPGRMKWFASVQPLEGASSLDDVRRAVEDYGASGVGEVFPGVQGFGIENRDWLRVVEYCVELGLPINMHVTDPVGDDYYGRVEEPLGDYVWLAKEYPELKLILAHWGGGLPFYEVNAEIKGVLKNIYYDTAASPLLYDIDIFKRVVEIVGVGKIIYGSDYPLRVYPKKGDVGFEVFLEEIRGCGIDEERLEMILGGNMLKLLDLG